MRLKVKQRIILKRTGIILSIAACIICMVQILLMVISNDNAEVCEKIGLGGGYLIVE